MTETLTKPHESKTDFLSKHRIEALADGLFAIVMTLLVLDLRVPDLAHNATAGELAQAIISQWRLFFSFTVTFILAAVYWLLHQRTLRLFQRLNKADAFLGLAPLLFVSLLPYSTATVGRYMGNATATALYFGNQFAIAFFIAWLWFRTRSRAMEPDEAREHKLVGIRVVALTVASLLAAITALFYTEYAWSAFLIAVLASRGYQKRTAKI